MPTAARLTAAIFFGIAAYIFSQYAVPYFPENQEPPYWVNLNLAAGVLSGWIICGTRAGKGFSPGIANGLTTGIIMVFWVYFIMSFHDMIKKSLRRIYDGPVEAIVDVFAIMIDWGKAFFVAELGIVLAVTSIIAGLITEIISRKWS